MAIYTSGQLNQSDLLNIGGQLRTFGSSGLTSVGTGSLRAGTGDKNKLAKLVDELCKLPSEHKAMDIKVLPSQEVISLTSGIDPICEGIPNALASMMLEACPTPRPFSQSLIETGLFYHVPAFYPDGPKIRTSHVGVAVLDKWATEFPRFAPFVDLYCPEWVREQITCDSFDYANGEMPKWMKIKFEKYQKVMERVERKLSYRRAVDKAKTALLYREHREEEKRHYEMRIRYMQAGQQSATSNTTKPTVWTKGIFNV